MIAIDSNVLVRYLTQDEPAQSARATALVEHELTEQDPGFVGLVVLVETVWVLQRLYRAAADEIRETVEDLLDASQLVVENRATVTRALALSRRSGGSFADAVIAASAERAGCEKVVTFDRGAVRVGMTRID